MTTQAPASRPLVGNRLLVIEDEPLIAEALTEDLSSAGFEVAGVANRLQQALQYIVELEFDAAIVDANLAGSSAAPAAQALRRLGRPYLVLSGYGRDQLPEAFVGVGFVRKPYRRDELIDRLKRVLATSCTKA